jgi:hypothetical protein
MNANDLISAWLMTRQGAMSWVAACGSETDATAIARACAATLAKPMTYEDVVGQLVERGEFEAAELFMQDSIVLDAVDAESLHRLEGRFEQVRGGAVEAARGRLADLQLRAEAHGTPIDVNVVIDAVRRRRDAGLALLAQVERRVEDAEADYVAGLRERLESASTRGLPESVLAEWRADIEHAISLGALDAASAAIDAGPSADRPLLVGVPAPPVWPYRREPLDFLVEWMFGDGVVPPGFERYRPDRADSAAWNFLAELRRRQARGESTSLLESLAGVLDCRLLHADISDEGVQGRLDDLGAPGFHAFGPRAWPDGIPVRLQEEDRPFGLGVAPEGLVIEVAAGLRTNQPDNVLRLDLHDVLAVLHDRPNRRQRLLAQLGRQLPLDRAFTGPRADESVRWERSDIPADITSGDRPVLLVGAPGMGKTTLLLELAQDAEGTVEVVSAARGGDLPEADLLLVDDSDNLGPDDIRRFVREVHWARTTRTPVPTVVVAVRPEKVAAVEQAAPNIFRLAELPPRSSSALREQARSMLGWVGVEAAAPGSYDRLAFLAGGNPTVLFHLCRALVGVLANAGDLRRFTQLNVETAWQDPSMQAAVRSLLWLPLRNVAGLADTLQVLVDFCDPGETLALDDATWAIKETLRTQDTTWIDERISLLARYGLIRLTEEGLGLSLGGPGLLVRSWLEEGGQAA